MKDRITRVRNNGKKICWVSNSVLEDENISTDAKFLLTVLLNKDEEKINFGATTKLFSWGKTRMANAKNELLKNGYLSHKKQGIIHYYVVDETGSLRVNMILEMAKQRREYLKDFVDDLPF